MKTRNSFLIGLAALLSMTVVNAQMSHDKNGGHHKRSMNHEQIVKTLNLDETTSQSLLELMNSHRAKHQAQRHENKENRHAMKKQNHADVKSLLGEKKFAEFEEIMQQKHKQKHSGKCNKKHSKHGEDD